MTEQLHITHVYSIKLITSQDCQVDSWQTLDNIQCRFNCFTREGVSEIIIDLDYLAQDELDELQEMLKLLNPVGSRGYLHLWK